MSKNPPSFDIPSLIPPLPSSSYGKENDRKVRNQKESHGTSISKESPSLSKPRRPLGLKTPQQTSSAARLGGSVDRYRSSPSPGAITSVSSTSKKNASRPVLRFGETTETLFCITAESSAEHRRLAKGIADGSLADHPDAWSKVLNLASAQRERNDADLIRLHRRATLRFPIDPMESEMKGDVVEIWTAFALVHGKLGMMDEARRTYRFIENQRVQLSASYYMQISKMEEKFDRNLAEEILMRGIEVKAEPEGLLKDALKAIRIGVTTAGAITESIHSPKRRQMESETSPKRQKTENGFIIRQLDEDRTASTEKVLEETACAESKKTTTTLPKPPGPTNITLSSMKAGNLANKENVPMVKSRPGRLLLSSRLGPKGLSGRAKRVEPESSIYEDSESELESNGWESTKPVSSSSVMMDTSSKPMPKIKKMDLSYMWEWDPNARGKADDNKARKPAMEKIDEGSASSGQTTTTSSRSGETNATATSDVSTSSKKSLVHGAEKTGESSTSVSTQNVPFTENIVKSEDKALSHINQEFLPLVHENNILRVNGSSFAKLGVIGKGGSCKVYRALSKKCSVVAIKKVKLEGMDKKAIEGYANEISLLKRLRGNPAIIQMYDAEVDLERKSIFVVMELGEADLNHILQQRAISGQSRSLNLNFIRLTWQQMLSAVHSIHEERIIHSDLKPANFLFVRGALKLIDFGIAKAIQSDDTTNIYRESHIGTLNYMSPEAILDTETGSNGPRMRIGRASDVWSLGCILYEMVHGKTPFAKLHFIQKLQAIVNRNHKIEISDDVDEWAADAIRQCLQRNPEDRPAIVGKGGLLNEHRFLHSAGRQGKAL